MVKHATTSGLQIRSSWRFFTRHPWQLWLTLLSIALGTAVMVAVDLANSSANESFSRSVSALSGPMTHELTASQGDVPEAVYRQLRIDGGFRQSVPLVEGVVSVGGVEYSLMGIDPFAIIDSSLARSLEQESVSSGVSARIIPRLLTETNSVLLPAELARSQAVKAGDELQVTANGERVGLRVLAIQDFDENGQRDARFNNVIVTDIATAQVLLNRPGVLSRIQLLLSETQADQLGKRLPATLILSSYRKQQQAFSQMTQAFRVNLTAMSLLAMLVGAFLVYNTMTFSVLQRRKTFAINRMLGITGAQIFRHMLAEALILGLGGSLLGVILGVVLGQGLLILVTQTISDLYVSVSADRLLIGFWPLMKSVGITLLAVLLATFGPALEAARVQPIIVSRSSHLEQAGRHVSKRLVLVGIACMGLTPVLIAVSGNNLIVGFSGLFLFVAGYSLIVPFLLAMFLNRAQRLSSINNLTQRMALRGVQASLSRTSLAIVALTVAVSATVGVSIMIGSFRASVADWLASTLRSDVYISAASKSASRSTGALDDAWLRRVQQLPEIAAVSTGRNLRVEMNGALIPMLVLQPGGHSARGFEFMSGDHDNIWQQFLQDEVILVSEPFAYHQQLHVGDKVTVLTGEAGLVDFTIAGVYQDYSASQGMAVMPRRLYEQFWSDRGISTIGMSLHNTADLPEVIQKLQDWAGESPEPVSIRSNQQIREFSLQVFDRTFAVTQVLRVLVVMVAFIGVFSALMALFLEKGREYAILRATGMTPLQLRHLVLLQAGLIGLLAGVLSLPLGWIMSDILIEVINRRSFGWTMQSHFFLSIPFQALALSIVAALLAALYPTRRISRSSVRQGLSAL